MDPHNNPFQSPVMEHQLPSQRFWTMEGDAQKRDRKKACPSLKCTLFTGHTVRRVHFVFLSLFSSLKMILQAHVPAPVLIKASTGTPCDFAVKVQGLRDFHAGAEAIFKPRITIVIMDGEAVAAISECIL